MEAPIKSVYIHDSIIDVSNRVMMRGYYHVSDASFVIKLFQCGTGCTLTRFLQLGYFARRDPFIAQLLQAELFDRIVQRATQAIRQKMYLYFCIQHKIQLPAASRIRPTESSATEDQEEEEEEDHIANTIPSSILRSISFKRS